MFQDLFEILNMERVIGLLCLAIMDKHGCLNQSLSLATYSVCSPTLRQILILSTVKHIVRLTFANMNLGLKVYESVFRRIMENHHKLSKDLLLFIHVIPLMKRMGSKDYMRHWGSFAYHSRSVNLIQLVLWSLTISKITQIISIKSSYKIRYPMKPMPTKSPMTWTKCLEALMWCGMISLITGWLITT